MPRVLSQSLEETAGVAVELLAGLKPDSSYATVLGLVGDLGSGKTTFVQSLARELGVTETVTSPTFVIEKIYPLKKVQGEALWSRLIHIDTYRLNKPEELLRLNWREIISRPENLIVLEWADKVDAILPPGARKIYFRFIDHNVREINWSV